MHVLFQHTAARRRLGLIFTIVGGRGKFQHTAARRRLAKNPQTITNHMRFNTQPPEGGWKSLKARIIQLIVSTHSRPKAAGKFIIC